MISKENNLANQTLENLKNIHKLQSDGDILSLLKSVKDAKEKVASFSKSLKTQLHTLETMQEKAITTPVEEKKIVQNDVKNQDLKSQNTEKQSAEKENIQRRRFDDNRVNSRNNRSSNTRQFDGSNGQNYQQRSGYDQNHGRYNNQFNKSTNGTWQKSNNGEHRQGGQRPTSGQNFGQRKNNFVSTKENSFKSFAPTQSNNMPNTLERNFGNKNKTKRVVEEDRKQIRAKQTQENRNYNFIIEDEDGFEETTMGSRKLVRAKKHEEVKVAPSVTHAIITSKEISVKDLSEKIGKPVTEIVKKLMLLGVMATINSNIDFDTAELVANELGVSLELKLDKTYEEKLKDYAGEIDKTKLVKRPPVITVMGHVDHGKTSLLDAFRATNVALGEAGGITQAIGAYQITTHGEKITFIDTPGHAAFTQMRARGASLTDIAILVVAADDGVMPQTIEAINHIKAAKVPMIVAINKMDKIDANVDRVKQQLAEHDVLVEEWGGDTICVPISAKTGLGLDKLIDAILLVAEMQDLRANLDTVATGVVIEAYLDKNRGAIANILVQNGTLKVGDSIMSGITFGKVKAMFDENGKSVKKATPSTPVSVMGLSDVPNSGDFIYAVEESLSKQVISERINKIKAERTAQTSGVSLDDFMSKIKEGKLKSLNVILKADTQGSVEAVRNSLLAIRNDEVKVSVLHAGVGAISESDVLLAETTGSIIVAFNIKPIPKAKSLAESLKIQIKEYKIIYEVVDEMTNAIKGMMSIKYELNYVGKAEVRIVFKLSTAGKVAGSYVQDGKIIRNGVVKVYRGKDLIGETTCESLKIVKDEKSEIAKGFECGIKLKDNIDFEEGDILEFYSKDVVKQ